MRIFNVFVNRDLYWVFKRFVWRIEDDYVLRLGGVQLKLNRDEKMGVFPVYYPLFTWRSKPGTKELAVYWGKATMTFIWSNGKFYIYKSDSVELEEQ